jgi:hypothetical protein
MRSVVIGVVLCLVMCNTSEARRFVRNSSYPSYSYSNASVDNSSAQGVANTMARMNRRGHFGGHAGMFEGCGSGPTPDEACRNCCYSDSGMPVVDMGYAMSSSGTWYCCKRYRPK